MVLGIGPVVHDGVLGLSVLWTKEKAKRNRGGGVVGDDSGGAMAQQNEPSRCHGIEPLVV